MTLSRRQVLSLAAAASLFWPLPLAQASYQARLIRVKRRPPAPDFAAASLNGDLLTLKEYRGKVLMLNFWATWCPPCRREMPSIEALWQTVRDKDIGIIGVHVGPSKASARYFAETNELTFPIIVDEDRDISAHYGVRSMPTTVIIGPDGHVDYVAFGPRDWNSPDTRTALLALRKPLKT